MKDTFEDYLKELHAESYSGTDDDMPEAFDAWLGELDVEALLRCGQIYGMSQHVKGMKEAMSHLR